MSTLSSIRARTKYLAVALAAATAFGSASCAVDPVASPVDLSDDEVTSVVYTAVRRQSIGNCWIYATMGWVESLILQHAQGTGRTLTDEEQNLSESYVTYWHWYGEITGGQSGDEIETGGWFGTAADIMLARGIATEAAFLREEAALEMSAAQSRALARMNQSLRDGALSQPAARRDGAIVRRELNAAFGLSEAVVADMDTVFGADGRRTLPATGAGSVAWIRHPGQFSVYSSRRDDVQSTLDDISRRRVITLADAMGRSSSSWNPDSRTGTYAWTQLRYPYGAQERTQVLRRVQSALNDRQPVVISWLVDFNALDSNGAFRLEELRQRGIGRQGGHLSLLNDYTVTLDGRTLPFGTLSREEQNAALRGTVTALQIKNSWGRSRADRASMEGYYVLNLDYLEGPIDWRPDGSPNSPTTSATPLSNFMMPPGYDSVTPPPPPPACAAPRRMCGANCVDLQTDAAHCGACNTACAADQACRAGVCTAMTPTGAGTCASPRQVMDRQAVTGTTTGMTSSQAGTCGGRTAVEQVFAYTATRSGTVTVSTCGSQFDTVLYVRSGACATGMQLACNDDSTGGTSCGNVSSRVTFTATAGSTYFLFVDGYGTTRGNFRLEVTPPS